MRRLATAALTLALIAGACSDDNGGDGADTTTSADPATETTGPEADGGADFEGFAAYLNGEEIEPGVTADELAGRYAGHDCSTEAAAAEVLPADAPLALYDGEALAATYFVCGAAVTDAVIDTLPEDQRDVAEAEIGAFQSFYASE